MFNLSSGISPCSVSGVERCWFAAWARHHSLKKNA